MKDALPYGPPLTLEAARKILAAAEAKAKSHGWPVAIAIVDSAADVVLFAKLDDTQHSSGAIATGKALTAANFRRPTQVFQEGIAAGGEGLRFLAVPGVLSSQDAEVAHAGLAALR